MGGLTITRKNKVEYNLDLIGCMCLLILALLIIIFLFNSIHSDLSELKQKKCVCNNFDFSFLSRENLNSFCVGQGYNYGWVSSQTCFGVTCFKKVDEASYYDCLPFEKLLEDEEQ